MSLAATLTALATSAASAGKEAIASGNAKGGGEALSKIKDFFGGDGDGGGLSKILGNISSTVGGFFQGRRERKAAAAAAANTPTNDKNTLILIGLGVVGLIISIIAIVKKK